MSKVSDKVDVIVIGAGISGLSSAKLLHENGINVVVLEARSRVGGRTFTKRDANTYKYVDLGGSYVGPSQNRILRMAKEFGIDTYKINSEGCFAFFHNGRCQRFVDSLPKYTNPLIWLDMNHLLRTMDKLSEKISLEAPWDCAHAEEWDNMTVKEFLDQLCWTETAKEFGRAFVNLNVAAEASEVSLLWFLWYVKNCGGVKRIWDVDGGAQERKFIGGSMRISECIAQKLGDRVKLNHAVSRICDDKDDVVVETLDGAVFKAQHVVVALAPALQLKIAFHPPLPSLRQQLMQRVPMGCTIKNQAWFKRPFWRENGMNGYGTASSAVEPVGNTVDDCRPGDDLFSIVGFILGDQARRLTKVSREERKAVTCEYYSRLFDSSEALNPVYYEDHDWLAEEYSAGCYTGTYPPGVLTRYGRELRTPVNHVYFAGTETATEWSGYMDGAVQAGERAARQILHGLGRINESQIYQTEPESLEYPTVYIDYTFVEKHAPTAGQALWLLGALSVAGAVATGWLLWKRQ